jgi:hypothetical protein
MRFKSILLPVTSLAALLPLCCRAGITYSDDKLLQTRTAAFACALHALCMRLKPMLPATSAAALLCCCPAGITYSDDKLLPTRTSASACASSQFCL